MMVALYLLHLLILLRQSPVHFSFDLSELQLDMKKFGFRVLQRSLECNVKIKEQISIVIGRKIMRYQQTICLKKVLD